MEASKSGACKKNWEQDSLEIGGVQGCLLRSSNGIKSRNLQHMTKYVLKGKNKILSELFFRVVVIIKLG